MSNVLLVTGISSNGRPFAAYGKSSEVPAKSSRLELIKSGVVGDGCYNTMLARYDRALFAGNGPHIGIEGAEGKGPGMFRDYGNLFEEQILPRWVRQYPHHYIKKPPVSLVVLIDEDSGKITPRTTFSAGIVKRSSKVTRDIPETFLPPYENIFVMTADDWHNSEHCKGFSTKDLALANNNGSAPYIPIKKYPISGTSSDEVASKVYEFMGEDVVAACAAMFEDDRMWHMAVKNRQ